MTASVNLTTAFYVMVSCTMVQYMGTKVLVEPAAYSFSTVP